MATPGLFVAPAQRVVLDEQTWQSAAAFALAVGGAARAHVARAEVASSNEAREKALVMAEWLWSGKSGAVQLGASSAFIGLRGLLKHGEGVKSAVSPLGEAMKTVARLGAALLTGGYTTKEWLGLLREQALAACTAVLREAERGLLQALDPGLGKHAVSYICHHGAPFSLPRGANPLPITALHVRVPLTALHLRAWCVLLKYCSGQGARRRVTL